MSERVDAGALRHWVNGLGYRSARRPTTCTPDCSTLSRFNLTHPRHSSEGCPTTRGPFPLGFSFDLSLPPGTATLRLPSVRLRSPLALTRRILSSSSPLRALLDRRRYSITDTFRISMHPFALPRRKRVYRFIKSPFVRQITFPRPENAALLPGCGFFLLASINRR